MASGRPQRSRTALGAAARRPARRPARRCGCPARRSRAPTGTPVRRSHSTVVSRWLAMPRAATWSAAMPASAQRLRHEPLRRCARSPSASCSTQPGRGKCCWCSRWATDTSRPRWSKRMQRVEVVPWSIATHVPLGHAARPSPSSRAYRGCPEVAGDRAGGVPDVARPASGRGRPLAVAEPLDRAGDADRADHQAAVAADRRGDAGLARRVISSTSTRPARRRGPRRAPRPARAGSTMVRRV